VFQIVDVTESTLFNQKLFFDVGIPENHAVIETNLTLVPSFVEVYTQQGSKQGSVIQLNVQGVVPNMVDQF
jgi:hypothetical protein